MAALTADVHIPHLGTPTKIKVKAVGADTFYAGALVFADGTNGKAQVVPAATDSFLGICAKQVVVSAADELVEIYVDGIWALAFTGVAEVDVGQTVVVDMTGTLSDNEADLVSAADATIVAGDILIGKCIGINEEETTRGWVMLHTPSGVANVLGWL
jgi:hypothetical protein